MRVSAHHTAVFFFFFVYCIVYTVTSIMSLHSSIVCCATVQWHAVWKNADMLHFLTQRYTFHQHSGVNEVCRHINVCFPCALALPWLYLLWKNAGQWTSNTFCDWRSWWMNERILLSQRMCCILWKTIQGVFWMEEMTERGGWPSGLLLWTAMFEPSKLTPAAPDVYLCEEDLLPLLSSLSYCTEHYYT